MQMRTISFVFEVTSCVLGTVFNVLLLWIAAKSTKKSSVFSEFGKIVKVNALFDVYLILSTMISGAQIDTQGGIFFMVDGYDRRGLSPLVNTLFGFFWTSSIGFAALYGPLPMYFRYVTFCKEETVSTLRIFFWITIVVTAAVWNCSWALYSAYDNFALRDNYTQLLDREIWALPDGEMPFFSAVSLTNIGGLMFAGSCTVSFCFATSFGVYLVLRIRSKLEEISKSALSEKTKRLQAQMNRMIIFQLFIATVLGQLPVLIVAVQMIFQTHLPTEFNIIVGCLDPLLPVVNPLADILFVDAYRRQLFALPRRIWSKNSVGDTSTELDKMKRRLSVVS